MLTNKYLLLGLRDLEMGMLAMELSVDGEVGRLENFGRFRIRAAPTTNHRVHWQADNQQSHNQEKEEAEEHWK